MAGGDKKFSVNKAAEVRRPLRPQNQGATSLGTTDIPRSGESNFTGQFPGLVRKLVQLLSLTHLRVSCALFTLTAQGLAKLNNTWELRRLETLVRHSTMYIHSRYIHSKQAVR